MKLKITWCGARGYIGAADTGGHSDFTVWRSFINNNKYVLKDWRKDRYLGNFNSVKDAKLFAERYLKFENINVFI